VEGASVDSVSAPAVVAFVADWLPSRQGPVTELMNDGSAPSGVTAANTNCISESHASWQPIDSSKTSTAIFKEY